jgi:1,4-dihydroxy-2-naphthoate octaprenyltransferase
MKYSDFIWNEFVYGGHWLSIGAGSIVFSAMIIFNMMIRWEFILIIYLIVQCSYNYNHFKELNSDMISDSPRAIHLNKYITAMPFIIFLYGLFYVIILLLFGNVLSIIFGLILLVISLFFTYKGKKIFSRLMGFKSYYAALTWAALIPFTAIYISYTINLTVFLFSLYVFIRLLVSINFFDIKDITSDSKDKIRTLVLGLGKEKFISFLHILNLTSMFLILFGIFFNIFPLFTFALTFLFFYSYIYIIKGREKKEEIQNISYIFVDGEYYFWPIALFLGVFALRGV